MKNSSYKYSKQQLLENFLNYELDLSKNNKSKRIIYIPDLLSNFYSNEQFIKELYRNLLEREPDSSGYDHYLNLLKAGKITKKILLYSFIKSPEAQKINAEIRFKKLTYSNFFFRLNLFLKKIKKFLIYHHLMKVIF